MASSPLTNNLINKINTIFIYKVAIDHGIACVSLTGLCVADRYSIYDHIIETSVCLTIMRLPIIAIAI